MLLPHAGAGFGRALARVLVRGALPKQFGVTRLDCGPGGHGGACGQEGEKKILDTDSEQVHHAKPIVQIF